MWNLPVRPPVASEFAQDYDLLFFVISALALFFTVLVAVLIAILGFRYRRGSKVDRSGPVDTDHRLELIWTVIPMVLAMGVFIWSARLYVEAYNVPKNAKEIYIIGKQWMWHAQHVNGIRENNELTVPVGEPVKLNMISQDVIHSFFIPAFRIKRDVFPGIPTSQWFTPTKPGRYYLFCAEYCGTQHSEMTGWVNVMEKADFGKWYAGQDPLTPATASGPSAAQASVSGPQTMAAGGREIYERLACGSCHDPSGMNRGPSLAGIYGRRVQIEGGRTVLADHAYLRESILYSDEKIAERYQQIMPAYRDQLTEEQVNQLVVYIRSLSDPTMEGQTVEGWLDKATEPKGRRPADASTRGAATTGQQPTGSGNQNTTVTGGGAIGTQTMQGPTGSPASPTENEGRGESNMRQGAPAQGTGAGAGTGSRGALPQGGGNNASTGNQQR